MKRNFFFASLLLGASLLMATPSMAQDKLVKLTTAKEIGQPITLIVNHNNKGVSVDWGDGKVETYQTSKAEGICNVEGIVKGKVITISGGDNWTMLACKGCGLTDIDLSKAKDLHSLYCQNNQLTSLNLSGMKKLVDLNCSNNQISKLVFNSGNVSSELASLQNFNIANNQMTGYYNYKLKDMQHLNVSNNKYKALYIYDTELRSVDCSNNNIEGFLNLKSCEHLNNVIFNNNQISNILLANNGEFIHQLYGNDNNITILDLSLAEKLTDLVCQNNKLKSLTTHSKARLDVMNVSNNNLAFNCLPSKSYAPEYLKFAPQGDYNISNAEGLLKKDGVPYAPLATKWSEIRKVAIDLTIPGSLSNNRYDATYEWCSVNADGSETPMVQRKSSTQEGDFYATHGKFSFFTPQKKAYLKLTSKSYGFVIKTTPIAIGDDITGVEQMVTSNGLEIAVANGTIILNSTVATPVNIYTTDGKQVWQNVVSGTTSVKLPKGVYVVNGKKVIL